MASVIKLSNSSGKTQVAVGAAYFTLKILFWGLAWAFEPKDIWDMERNQPLDADAPVAPQPTTMTRALWYAIRHTKGIAWVRRANIALITGFWGSMVEGSAREC
ncbi:hypothetical protein BDV23DRAFT_148646 [Aspergillus alliaceus]|uniref:Uncharacterized protein n=1 Tax=Petromyces alliaceus TaxID=209559 RepID=A0A5N7CIT8_PETAA|nr:hypothetical protein BDV23DRAFT_148646 [Aspergillus alliaceus]